MPLVQGINSKTVRHHAGVNKKTSFVLFHLGITTALEGLLTLFCKTNLHLLVLVIVDANANRTQDESRKLNKILKLGTEYW